MRVIFTHWQIQICDVRKWRLGMRGNLWWPLVVKGAVICDWNACSGHTWCVTRVWEVMRAFPFGTQTHTENNKKWRWKKCGVPRDPFWRVPFFSHLFVRSHLLVKQVQTVQCWLLETGGSLSLVAFDRTRGVRHGFDGRRCGHIWLLPTTPQSNNSTTKTISIPSYFFFTRLVKKNTFQHSIHSIIIQFDKVTHCQTRFLTLSFWGLKIRPRLDAFHTLSSLSPTISTPRRIFFAVLCFSRRHFFAKTKNT